MIIHVGGQSVELIWHKAELYDLKSPYANKFKRSAWNDIGLRLNDVQDYIIKHAKDFTP